MPRPTHPESDRHLFALLLHLKQAERAARDYLAATERPARTTDQYDAARKDVAGVAWQTGAAADLIEASTPTPVSLAVQASLSN